MKRVRFLFLLLFFVCLGLLIGNAMADFSSKTIIGGADYPTFLFSMRQVVSSTKGMIIYGCGLVSLIVFIVMSLKKE